MSAARPSVQPERISRFIRSQEEFAIKKNENPAELKKHHAEAFDLIKLFDGRKLGRVFNGFPAIADEATRKRWIAEFVDIFKNIKIVKVNNNDVMVDMPSPEDEARIIRLIDDMVINACASILNPTATALVRQDVIDYLGWHDAKDPAQDKKLQAFIQQSAKQIVASFVETSAEIVMHDFGWKLEIRKVTNKVTNIDEHIVEYVSNDKSEKPVPAEKVQAASSVFGGAFGYGLRLKDLPPLIYARNIRHNASVARQEIADELVNFLYRQKMTPADLAALAFQLEKDFKDSSLDRANQIKFWLMLIDSGKKKKLPNFAEVLGPLLKRQITDEMEFESHYQKIIKQLPTRGMPGVTPSADGLDKFKQFFNLRDNNDLLTRAHQFLDANYMFDLLGDTGVDIGHRAAALRDQAVFKLAEMLAGRVREFSLAENLQFAYAQVSKELAADAKETEKQLPELLKGSLVKMMIQLKIEIPIIAPSHVIVAGALASAAAAPPRATPSPAPSTSDSESPVSGASTPAPATPSKSGSAAAGTPKVVGSAAADGKQSENDTADAETPRRSPSPRGGGATG